MIQDGWNGGLTYLSRNQINHPDARRSSTLGVTIARAQAGGGVEQVSPAWFESHSRCGRRRLPPAVAAVQAGDIIAQRGSGDVC